MIPARNATAAHAQNILVGGATGRVVITRPVSVHTVHSLAADYSNARCTVCNHVTATNNNKRIEFNCRSKLTDILIYAHHVYITYSHYSHLMYGHTASFKIFYCCTCHYPIFSIVTIISLYFHGKGGASTSLLPLCNCSTT
jgi:hypothetical protein